MNRYLRLLFTCVFCLSLTLHTPATAQSTACAVYAEQGGLLVLEAESALLSDDWSFRNEIEGSLGQGYYEWKHGNASQNIDGAGDGVLVYTFQIQTPGTYQLILRSAAPHNTEHNDVWALFQRNDVVARQSSEKEEDLGQDEWFKVYQNAGGNDWNWAAYTVDHDAHDIFALIDAPGEYVLELSGRSTLFKIDRIVLFHESVDEDDAISEDNTESPCFEGAPTNVESEVPVESALDIMALYPNPLFSEAMVDYSASAPGALLISVYNAIGQLVKQDVLPSGAGANQYRLTVPELRNGHYWVEIQNEVGETTTRSFIVMR